MLAYAAGGFPLVVLLRALLMAAAAGLTGLIAFRRTGSFYSATGAALLSAAISYRFAYDRPLLVTFLFVAAVMAMLEYRRWLWALPVLFVVWANCHGGFFMGWVVLAAYCAESLVRRRADRLLYGVTAASVLASGLNPNGFGVFATLLEYRQSYMQSMLAEWRPTPLWPLSPFVAIAAVAGVLLVLARGKARLADWLLFAAFAIAGLYAFRNVVYMAIAGPVAIAAYLPWKLKPLAAKWEVGHRRCAAGCHRVTRIAKAGVPVVGVGGHAARRRRPVSAGASRHGAAVQYLRAGRLPDVVPVAAAQSIRRWPRPE